MCVIGIYAGDSEIEQAIEEFGRSEECTLARVEKLPPRPETPLDALVVGPLCEDPVAALQMVRKSHDELGIVVCVRSARIADISRVLRFSPLVPSNLEIVPDSDPRQAARQAFESAQRARKRRRTHADIRAANERLRGAPPVSSAPEYFDHLLGLAPIGVLSLDEQLVVLTSNTKASQLFHLGGEDRPWLPGKLAEPWRSALERAARESISASGPTVRTIATPGQTYLRLTISRYLSASGSRRLLLLAEDITQRVEWEKERAEAARAREKLLQSERQARIENERLAKELGEAKALLDVLVDRAPVGLGFWDTQLRFVRVNEALAQMNGLPASAHLGKTVAELLPQVEPAVMEAFARVVSEGRPILNQEVVGETPAAPGEKRHFRVSYYPIRLGEAIAGAGAVCEEITERKRIESERAELLERAELRRQEAEQALAELRRVNAELEQFAYVASHDLQEPLRTIGSYTQLLARDYRGKLDPGADEYVEAIVSGVSRMRELIQDLLDYSRVTRDEDVPSQRVDMNRVAASVLDGMRAGIEDSGASVQLRDLPVLPAADPHQMQQLLQNLLSNAIKYSRPGVPPHIEVSAVRQEDHWHFCVADNGQGFDPRYARRIFGIFKRLHGREIPGTGIGLALCQRIVERHRGRIWAEAKPGEGARFYFTLPA